MNNKTIILGMIRVFALGVVLGIMHGQQDLPLWMIWLPIGISIATIIIDW